ncbi:hypothetical protein AURDEDRAFT_164684 [Auricularia subglabra TFB-10046 SS5]|nr:hypothetical protein AURDEDRAFT_164684 [Auricularia subglabra TFB-10046 SS5]
MSSIRRLPVEIVTMVMGSTDVSQLLLLSHVCADWNAIARAHPLFWRDIWLAALSTTVLDFFRARLACSGDRAVSITLHLAEHPMCVELRAVVLAAITPNIHRIAVYLYFHAQSRASRATLNLASMEDLEGYGYSGCKIYT